MLMPAARCPVYTYLQDRGEEVERILELMSDEIERMHDAALITLEKAEGPDEARLQLIAEHLEIIIVKLEDGEIRSSTQD